MSPFFFFFFKFVHAAITTNLLVMWDPNRVTFPDKRALNAKLLTECFTSCSTLLHFTTWVYWEFIT